eukprot:6215877-Prymnesium_polylepis.2
MRQRRLHTSAVVRPCWTTVERKSFTCRNGLKSAFASRHDTFRRTQSCGMYAEYCGIQRFQRTRTHAHRGAY